MKGTKAPVTVTTSDTPIDNSKSENKADDNYKNKPPPSQSKVEDAPRVEINPNNMKDFLEDMIRKEILNVLMKLQNKPPEKKQERESILDILQRMR